MKENAIKQLKLKMDLYERYSICNINKDMSNINKFVRAMINEDIAGGYASENDTPIEGLVEMSQDELNSHRLEHTKRGWTYKGHEIFEVDPESYSKEYGEWDHSEGVIFNADGDWDSTEEFVDMIDDDEAFDAEEED